MTVSKASAPVSQQPPPTSGGPDAEIPHAQPDLSTQSSGSFLSGSCDVALVHCPPGQDEAEIENMVMAQLKGEPAPGQPTKAPAQTQAPAEKINWSTHKKEGMRLDRLIESNREAFPHMAKMWNGTNKDQTFLETWVCNGL